MIEPTESESKVEVDRLINAFISIRQEIKEVEVTIMIFFFEEGILFYSRI